MGLNCTYIDFVYLKNILLLTDVYAIRQYSKTKDEKKSERSRSRHRRRDYSGDGIQREKDRVYTMFARLRKASEFQEFTRRKSRVFG